MDLDNPVQWIMMAGAVALLPVLVGVGSVYLKVSIVLGLLRQGLGTQSTPSGLVITILSLGITWLVTNPVVTESYMIFEQARGKTRKAPQIKEFLANYQAIAAPYRRFLIAHTGGAEIEYVVSVRSHQGANPDERDIFAVLIPAFMLSELKAAFHAGLLVLLPFFVIDLVVANILAGLGMYMLSPITISLPLKLLLFVSSDAWLMLTHGLVRSYGVEG